MMSRHSWLTKDMSHSLVSEMKRNKLECIYIIFSRHSGWWDRLCVASGREGVSEITNAADEIVQWSSPHCGAQPKSLQAVPLPSPVPL